MVVNNVEVLLLINNLITELSKETEDIQLDINNRRTIVNEYRERIRALQKTAEHLEELITKENPLAKIEDKDRRQEVGAP
jgi:hypothetical protein